MAEENIFLQAELEYLRIFYGYGNAYFHSLNSDRIAPNLIHSVLTDFHYVDLYIIAPDLAPGYAYVAEFKGGDKVDQELQKLSVQCQM